MFAAKSVKTAKIAKSLSGATGGSETNGLEQSTNLKNLSANYAPPQVCDTFCQHIIIE